MDRMDEKTQRIFAEHEKEYLNPPEEDDFEYCDYCGERIHGKFYCINNNNYCLDCMEYFERNAD